MDSVYQRNNSNTGPIRSSFLQYEILYLALELSILPSRSNSTVEQNTLRRVAVSTILEINNRTLSSRFLAASSINCKTKLLRLLVTTNSKTCIVQGKGLKLKSWKARTLENTTTTSTFDAAYFDESQVFMDVGKETIPVLKPKLCRMASSGMKTFYAKLQHCANDDTSLRPVPYP
jgi:hypothetical protein